MRKQGTLLFGIAGLGLAVAASPAAGSPVTWEFAGEITSVTDDDGSLGGVFTVGMPFSGMFTFESTTPDSFPDILDSGLYEGAVTSVTGLVGGVPFFELTILIGNIRVRDNSGGDSMRVTAPTEFLGAAVGFTLSFSDSAGGIFSDDSLPLTPPALSALDSTFFALELEPDGDALVGQITGLTPEPGTIVLLLAGTSFLFRRKAWR